MKAIDAGAWVLRIPTDLSPTAPIVCVPTVHPRGDQRVLRVAQAALNAGFRVKFIWPGGEPHNQDPRVQEVTVAEPRTTRERLKLVPKIARLTSADRADIFHIHDLYFLPFVATWARRDGVPFVYDIHEHYGIYYASRLRLRGWLRDAAARTIDKAQMRFVRANGAVNAVAEEIAAPYREAGIPASVSPNYPLPAEGAAVTAALLQARSKGAIHIGTLSAPYGMERLLRLAAALSEDPADFTIDVVSRFPNAHSREEFEELFHRYGSPRNLRVIPAVPAHEIPGLLSEYRVGLSMLEDGGQNDIAIPTKLYEYVRAGLAIVGTDRAAQRRFLAEYGVGTLSDDDAELANALRAYLSGDTGVDSELERTAVEARDAFNWNLVSKDVGELLQGIRRRRGA